MSDDTPNLIYLVLLLVLVGSALTARQLPIRQSLKIGLAWVGIFGLIFIIAVFRHDFGALAARLKAEVTGGAIEGGEEMRIPMAEDGHFWVTGYVNDQPVRFLIDSGATTTTVSRKAANAAGLETDFRSEAVDTANGTVVMKKSRASKLRVGTIEARDIGINVNGNDDVNVLGMNFLSSLSSWRVEGRFLVLKS